MGTWLVTTRVRQLISDATITTPESAVTTAEANITIGGSGSVTRSRKVGSKISSGDTWQNQSGDKSATDPDVGPFSDQ